jgi:SAM-dependent methyltransferase
VNFYLKKTVWDRYWKKSEIVDIHNIEKSDSNYRLLKRLITLDKKYVSNILEIGCGSGIKTLSILMEFQGSFSNALLMDSSLHALLLAKKNINRNKVRTPVNLVLADALNPPLSQTFNIVWNSGTIEHFEGALRQRILRKMACMCDKDGQVIVIVPNSLNLPYRIWKKILERKGKWKFGYEEPYTIFELEERLKKVGMICTKKRGVSIIRSLLLLINLIAANPNARSKIRREVNIFAKWKFLNSLLKYFDKIENVLDKLFGIYLGRSIGVCGKFRSKR